MDIKPIRLLSAAEQVAAQLRVDILEEKLGVEMPGIHQLAAAMLVNHKTVKAALGLLEKEGLLVPQGAGRRRRIALPKGGKISPSLRIALLNYEPPEGVAGYMSELMHLLVEAGHNAFFSGKSLTELGMDLGRIVRHVEETKADAWVVMSGSRELLEWFATREIPAFAMFGRRRGLPLAAAGPDKPPAYEAVAQRLAEHGHRRIALITRRERRFPEPGASEKAFLTTFRTPDLGRVLGEFKMILI